MTFDPKVCRFDVRLTYPDRDNLFLYWPRVTRLGDVPHHVTRVSATGRAVRATTSLGLPLASEGYQVGAEAVVLPGADPPTYAHSLAGGRCSDRNVYRVMPVRDRYNENARVEIAYSRRTGNLGLDAGQYMSLAAFVRRGAKGGTYASAVPAGMYVVAANWHPVSGGVVRHASDGSLFVASTDLTGVGMSRFRTNGLGLSHSPFTVYHGEVHKIDDIDVSTDGTLLAVAGRAADGPFLHLHRFSTPFGGTLDLVRSFVVSDQPTRVAICGDGLTLAAYGPALGGLIFDLEV